MRELHGARTRNCFRAAISLEEAGVDYTVHPVNLLAGEHRSPAHLAINPAGKVPTLVDRSGPTPFVLSQSNAIALYADQLQPGRLLPVQPQVRALTLERWLYFVTDVIAASHASWALRWAPNPQPEASAFHTRRAVEALLFAERFVTDEPFMAGQAFSLADIAAVTIADVLHESVDWSKHSALAAWHERARARPAVQRGLKAFG